MLAPVIVQLFDCNYALYKTETSLKTDNGHVLKPSTDPLRSALGSEKYRKTEI